MLGGKRRGKFTIYQDAELGWRWRLVAGNGENIGPASEAYTRYADAVRGAKTARRVARTAKVET
jgi:uncharacterized protein YegP (UPF0339 family)